MLVCAHSLLGAAFFVLDLLGERTACQIALPIALGAIFAPLRFYPVLIQKNAISEALQISDKSSEENRVALAWKARLCL